MNLRDLSCDLVEYISDRSDDFTCEEAQAFRVVMCRIMDDAKQIADADEATALRMLRDLK
jgi:hypothetical protein